MTIWLNKTQALLNQNNWAEAKKYLKSHGLDLLPAMIDSHVHFRTPGATHKEDWQTATEALVNSGIPAVIDMPNNSPAITNLKKLNEKIKIIKKQLKYPVGYFFYLGAEISSLPNNKLLKKVVGLKVYLGSTTGSLLVDEPKHLERIFKTWHGLLSFHAEDENLIKARTEKYKNLKTIKKHSIIRNDEVAVKAIKQVIKLAKKYQRQVYICHVSTKTEIELIKKAKKQGVKIYAEVTPHHLFLNQTDYQRLGNKVKVNPPLRTKKDNQALWQAVNDGTIDVLATDHAPHLLKEKNQSYDKAPAGIPEIDTFLPLMLNSVNKKKLTLKKMIKLMHKNPKEIFKLKDLDKYGTIVNMNLTKKVQRKNLKTKCDWSPYERWKLKGWPVATILNNKIYLIT